MHRFCNSITHSVIGGDILLTNDHVWRFFVMYTQEFFSNSFMNFRQNPQNANLRNILGAMTHWPKKKLIFIFSNKFSTMLLDHIEVVSIINC